MKYKAKTLKDPAICPRCGKRNTDMIWTNGMNDRNVLFERWRCFNTDCDCTNYFVHYKAYEVTE